MKNILVIAELLDGKSRTATLSALGFAKQAAQAKGGSFDILCIGTGSAQAAADLQGFGARQVITCEIPGGYVCERYAPTISALVKDKVYDLITASATTYGKDLMPRVAARVGAGVASDIAGADFSQATPRYRRPMYAGNVYGWLEITTPVSVVTVRQSEFSPATPSGGTSALTTIEPIVDGASERVTYVSLEASVKSARPDLAEAKVVVAGGRALKSAENFKTVLEPLVDALGAAMGASRAACDAGYVPNDLQVGQTGKVVAPQLYIAVGISGAIQHLAGMKGSKVIVAINKDKEAPIVQVADYFLQADLFTAVPELLGELQKRGIAS